MSDVHKITPVKVTPVMRKTATQTAKKQPVLKNSIRSGSGTVYGCLGELVFVSVNGGRLESTYDYDVVMPDGTTVDVKTKCVTSEPYPHYECSVAAFNPNQDCDYYAFVRVLKDKSRGWYLGAMKKSEYFDIATYIKKGAVDESNGWRASANCYNVPISALGTVL